MKSLAIITARGGSKRIPRKNVKPFLGRPILAYSVEAAMGSGMFEEVMVSTDDPEIAVLSRQLGATVPFYRSDTTAGDYATTAEVLLEVLQAYEAAGKTYDYVCCIYPTAPFVTAAMLQDAMRLLQEKGADSVIPVTKFSYPPMRGLVMRQEEIAYKWPENRSVRSQDLEEMYHDCGQFYCLSVEQFLAQKQIFMEHSYPYVLPSKIVQDIDTLEDWELAEMKYRLLQERD